jgi:antitoxin component YwqK of YwqJK toxin-antitoxin module
MKRKDFSRRMIEGFTGIDEVLDGAENANLMSVGYYKNGLLHRENGPAIEWFVDGTKMWFIKNERHNENGPAIEYLPNEFTEEEEDGCDETRFWYLNDRQFTEKDWKIEVELIKKRRENR